MTQTAPAERSTTSGPALGLVIAALGVVYVVWGSTYLGIRIVVEEAPPLTSMGLRFLTAGLLLGVLLSFKGGPRRLAVRPRELAGAALLGLMLPMLGNGLVSVGEDLGAPSGATALLIAIAPLIIAWAGFGYSSKIWIAAIIAFFPVYVNALTGILTVDEDAREMFRSLGASRWQTFTHLMVPGSLPVMFAGLKTAAGLALVGAVVGEFISAERGLGVLAILHDPNLALRYADHVTLLRDGRVLDHGAAAATLTAENLERLYRVPVVVSRGEAGGPPYVTVR